MRKSKLTRLNLKACDFTMYLNSILLSHSSYCRVSSMLICSDIDIELLYTEFVDIVYTTKFKELLSHLDLIIEEILEDKISCNIIYVVLCGRFYNSCISTISNISYRYNGVVDIVLITNECEV